MQKCTNNYGKKVNKKLELSRTHFTDDFNYLFSLSFFNRKDGIP